MKNLKSILGIFTIATLLFTSCQNEEDVYIDQGSETNASNSKTADLLTRNNASDGSNDDILDGISCASIVFPVVATINGQEVTLVSESSLSLVAELFAKFTNDDDSVEFQYPIQVQLSNYSKVTIANQQEFDALRKTCESSDETRDDAISCLDLNFPIRVFTFDANAQQTGSVVLTSKQETYTFISGLDENQFFSIQYPISASSESNSQIAINSDLEFAEQLESCEASDDLEDEAEAEALNLRKELEGFLSDTTFKIDSGIKAGADFTSNFANFTFNFANDGQVKVRNKVTNILENVEAEFETESETVVLLDLEFEGNSSFSILNGTFKVISQTSSKIELESRTDSSFKIVFSKI
ncbi:hypothetical protein [Leeuwenhoekiella sp. MAR_2009_132]|uniref:hypothetical protein n=1 Tax=Leeuwenhoekiella sp. MAR_2009_132 TaxID=1392489 RepID=UPI00048A9206|nr:hypothetical protein [Leeuwenhoekiella sp. MAR_2009_132]